MPLENPNIVDAIGIETESDWAVLTIADSWDWEDEQAHLSALQAKLNSYFEFIAGGQIWASYPAANGRQIVIDIVSRFCFPAAGQELLAKASEVGSQIDVKVRHRVFEVPLNQETEFK